MNSMRTARVLWGALWRSSNNMDGCTEYLLHENCLPVLFRTRKEARYYIERTHGFIRRRKDLRTEPHGWKMPIPVRVKIAAIREGSDK